jgi:uncharacterized protein
MVSKAILKETILANERFILSLAAPLPVLTPLPAAVPALVKREGIDFPEDLSKVAVLYGVRRSGKTFILYDRFIAGPEDSLYVDFEDDRLAAFELADFDRLREAFLELKPHLIGRRVRFLFDEIQNVPGWEKFCRRAVEKENAAVIAAGSSSEIRPDRIHTSLRGRAWGIPVFPFSFREFLASKGYDPSDGKLPYGPDRPVLKNHFAGYLTRGGFPEVCLARSDFDKDKLLGEYLGAMFFKDLVERNRITNIPLLEALADKAFSSFSSKVSLTALYKQYKDSIPLSKDMLSKYFKYLLESMLVHPSRIFAESPYKRMRHAAKIYLADNGLARRVSSADSGRLLENLVFLELKRRGYEIFYYSGARECDFVARSASGDLLPVQVCYELTPENRDREAGGLFECCSRFKLSSGLLLTNDDEGEEVQQGITLKIVPAWKWCLTN